MTRDAGKKKVRNTRGIAMHSLTAAMLFAMASAALRSPYRLYVRRQTASNTPNGNNTTINPTP